METDATRDHTTADEMTCPACNAKQTWSDECRRCKCDLTLLQRLRRARDTHRCRCLLALNSGHPQQALNHARRYAALADRQDGNRLLAVCHLLCGDWIDAVRLSAR